MTQIQLTKFISSLTSDKQKELVIRIHSSSFKKGLEKSRALLAQMDRNMRIQKLELAVKKLNLVRQWV